MRMERPCTQYVNGSLRSNPEDKRSNLLNMDKILNTTLLLAFATGAMQASSPRPNIILIVTDDLGYSELGCYGNSFNETPNLDAMAAQGLRLTSAYAAQTVSSPTRAALMTGFYPHRTGIIDYLRPDDTKTP